MDTDNNKPVVPTTAELDAATEKTFGQLMVREGLRQRGMSTRRNDWASEAWDEAKSDLAGADGSAETIAAMEVAETMAHAHSVLTALLTNVATTRVQVGAALDEIERNAQEALDGVKDGELGAVKLWPSLKALSRIAGTLRGNESILTAAVESAFRSFYESAQAIKKVHAAQDAHEKVADAVEVKVDVEVDIDVGDEA